MPPGREPVFDRPRLRALAARLEADVATGAIPGAALLIGGREGDLFAHEAGFRDPAARGPLARDAIWRIYSMTKPIVSMAGVALMERGVLRLDQPVADYIPAFDNLTVALPDGRRMQARKPPTIQDLMRHTAGLGYAYLGDSAAQQAIVADGLLSEDLPNAAFVARLAALPLEHQPGSVWHYSHATDVLGHVLEVAAGCDLQGVLDDTLLGPLGMAETWFRVPHAAAGRVAEPLSQGAGIRPNFCDPCAARASQRGNWGLFSTIDDQARFLRMMLNDGRDGSSRVVSPAAVALATADHLGRDIARAAYYPPGPGYGFGLGFAVRIAAGQSAHPGTVGDYFWSGVGGTYFWVDPARGFFVLLMMQTPDAAQRAHYRALARAMVYAALDE